VKLSCDFDAAHEIVRLIEGALQTTPEIQRTIRKAAQNATIHRRQPASEKANGSYAPETHTPPPTVTSQAQSPESVKVVVGARDDEAKRLHECQGSKCPKCELVFFGGLDKCSQCGCATEPAKWYSRFCLERLAFIVTVASICGIGALVSGEDAGTVFGAFFGTGFILFSMYYTANYFLGIGGFEERFAEGAVPPRAHLAFSFGRYFSEIFRVIGVFIALLLFVGLCMLIRWAFSGGD